VKQGDENGIWDVMCCASAAHNARVNELENLRKEVNSYKEQADKFNRGQKHTKLHKPISMYITI
jgi:hypothetical protein